MGKEIWYKDMYVQMFNAASEALEALEKQDLAGAREVLIKAQRQTEELYVGPEEQVLPFPETRKDS